MRQFQCVFGHAESQRHICAQFELGPYGAYENLYHFGVFDTHLRAHLIRNKNLPAAEFRAYFNSLGRLTPDEQKALATSPRLTKTQAKKFLRSAHLRNYLLSDIPNLLRHDILPEVFAAWGERIISTLCANPGLPPKKYRELFEYQPKTAEQWVEPHGECGDDNPLDVRYPQHWEVLAGNEATPGDILIEIQQRAPEVALREMLYRIGSLPISLYFAIPYDESSRNECMQAMEKREDEVRAWLQKEHPEMVDVPLDWVFEVLSPREW